MSDIHPTRQELESRWQKRVEDAKIRLDFASKYVKEVQRDQRSGTIPHPMVTMPIDMPCEPRPWLFDIIGGC